MYRGRYAGGHPGNGTGGRCATGHHSQYERFFLAAIAPFADAPVRIEGIGHIRGQECDRIHAIQTNLTALGIRCEEEETAATIYPGSPHGGSVETYDDHRVAMAFSLVGLRTDGIVIENPACCRKTFENYFTVLSELTGKKMEA